MRARRTTRGRGTTGTTARTAARLAAAAALALGLGLTACGGSPNSPGAGPAVDTGSADSGATDSGAAGGERSETGADAKGVPARPGEAPATGPKTEPLPLPATRSIVQVGEITVRVRDINEAATSAGAIAVGAKGVVAADRRTSDGASSQATLVLRVQPQDFTRVVGELAALGEEITRSLRTDDVTEAVVDLDSRIASQQASVTRTRVLLSRAERIADIVAVEGELARREADLAALQARKRTLADTVSLATITLNLYGPRAEVKPDEPETGFLAGLEAGWKAFLRTLTGLLTVVGAVLPFAVVLAVPAAVLWLVLRRRRRGTGPAAAAPAATPAPAADAS